MSARGLITAWPAPWTVPLSPPTVPPYGYARAHATSADCQARSCHRGFVIAKRQPAPLGTNASAGLCATRTRAQTGRRGHGNARLQRAAGARPGPNGRSRSHATLRVATDLTEPVGPAVRLRRQGEGAAPAPCRLCSVPSRQALCPFPCGRHPLLTGVQTSRIRGLLCHSGRVAGRVRALTDVTS